MNVDLTSLEAHVIKAALDEFENGIIPLELEDLETVRGIRKKLQDSPYWSIYPTDDIYKDTEDFWGGEKEHGK
jgi:hypothetical protein